MWSCALTRHDAPTSWGPMCRILYRLLVSLARLAVRSGRSKDLEIIVLRHQLTVLQPPEQPTSARRRGPGPARCHRGAPRPASGTEQPLRPSALLAYPAPPLTYANAAAWLHAVARPHQIRFAISEIRFTAGLWEPYDGRLSRTVLREREGRFPPATHHASATKDPSSNTASIASIPPATLLTGSASSHGQNA